MKAKLIGSKGYKDPMQIGTIANAMIIVLFIALCLTCVIPLVLLVSVSLSSAASISEYGYRLFPREVSFEAYTYLMSSAGQIFNSYIVSIIVTFVGTILGVFVTAMFSYVISRKYFKYRKVFSFFVFFTMLFSGGMVPSYIINTRYLHLNDTIWALILPLLVNGFYIMVLRTFYSTTIPDTIVEAAKIDGAGEFRIFLQIVFPLSKPGIATIALFTVIGYWNDWMSAMLYITEAKLAPIQYTLMKIQNNLEFLKNAIMRMGAGQVAEAAMNAPTDSTQMALTVLIIAPLLFAYPFFQQYFVKGLTIGGVKG